jgi:hypothetical protein
MEVVKITFVGTCEDYVYDLETEDGTYLGGDDILLKNTDSCMIKFNVPIDEYKEESGSFRMNDYMKKHFELAKGNADKITKVFKDPIKLEFEKVMYPYFLLEKKRYIYIECAMCEIHGSVMLGDESELIPMCPKCKIAHTIPSVMNKLKETIIDDTEEYEETEEEPGEEPGEEEEEETEEETDVINKADVINYKGISIARRDTCAYVKKVYLEILKIAMLDFIPGQEHIVINKAVEHAKECMKKLIEGNVNVKLLTLSKSLRGSYKVRPKYKGPYVKPENSRVITDITTPIKWDNAFCTWCQEECLDPEFNDNKKCKNCKKCMDTTKCIYCKDALVTVSSAHVYVAKVYKKLNPTNPLRPPDRVPFVFVSPLTNGKNIKQCNIASHPDYLNGRKIDHVYYFEHQMKEPISQILNLLLANAGTSSKDCEYLYSMFVYDVQRKKVGQKSFADMKKQ